MFLIERQGLKIIECQNYEGPQHFITQPCFRGKETEIQLEYFFFLSYYYIPLTW
jgi:hypothetical protein